MNLKPVSNYRMYTTDLYTARRREEPGAGKPHAWICKGAVG